MAVMTSQRLTKPPLLRSLNDDEGCRFQGFPISTYSMYSFESSKSVFKTPMLSFNLMAGSVGSDVKVT